MVVFQAVGRCAPRNGGPTSFLHLHFELISQAFPLKEFFQIDALNTKFSACSGNASTSSSWRFKSDNSTSGILCCRNNKWVCHRKPFENVLPLYKSSILLILKNLCDKLHLLIVWGLENSTMSFRPILNGFKGAIAFNFS